MVQGGNQSLSNFLPFFTGTMKPIKRKMSAKPVFEQAVIIGQQGDLFTRVRCWVYSPTLEYPEISVFLQLKNASGSCFTKLLPSDIQELSTKLTEWSANIEKVLPALQDEKAKLDAYVDQYNAYAELASQLQENQANERMQSNEEDPEPPKRRNRGDPRD